MEYLLLVGVGLVCMAFGYWIATTRERSLDDVWIEIVTEMREEHGEDAWLEFGDDEIKPSALPCNDPVASAYVRRIRNECDGLVEYLHNRGDQLSSDKGDRVAARIYKPLRQVDGIVNGFSHE